MTWEIGQAVGRAESGDAVSYIETVAHETLCLVAPVVRRFPTDSSHNEFFSITANGTMLLAKFVRDDYLSASTSTVEHEQSVMELAYRAGLGARPRYASLEHNLLVQDFLKGDSLPGWTAEHIALCARMGVRLMQIEIGNADLCLTHLEYHKDIAAHVKTLQSLDFSDPQLNRLKTLVLSLADPALAFCLDRQHRLDSLPTVLSHNDLSPDNIIRGPQGCSLIDFETAGLSCPDFLVGQLAVDSAIDDFLCGSTPRSFDHLWDIILNELPYNVSQELCRSRAIERLLQNAAYGLRQVARFGAVGNRRDYGRRKLAVATFCSSALDLCLRSW